MTADEIALRKKQFTEWERRDEERGKSRFGLNNRLSAASRFLLTIILLLIKIHG